MSANRASQDKRSERQKEIDKMAATTNSCPVHSPCNPLKHCPHRDRRK